jgi:hypothetical protein
MDVITVRERPMMARRAAILTFTIGGPLLWLPVLFVWALIRGYDFHGRFGSGLSISPAMGGFLWCLEAIFPRGWLFTWIPTLGTALLYGALGRRLSLAHISWLRARTASMLLHDALAAAISALVFSACIAVGALLGLQVPLLSTAQAPPDSFGVPDLSLSRESLIGMTAIIGGILGALLGALSPSVDALAADTVRSRTPPFVLPPSPSLRQIIGTFFVVGPLLCMPVMSMLFLYPIGGEAPLGRPFGHVISLPLLAPVGAIVWYGAFFFPPAWLQTWIPTLGTAVLFWAVLARSPIRRWASSRGALGVVLAYAMTCGALSVGVFALCQSLDGLLTRGVTVKPNDDGFIGLMQTAAGHTMLMAVAILGVIIGAVVFVLENRKSRS